MEQVCIAVSSCLWAELDKMEEAVWVTRAWSRHTLLPGESSQQELRVSWDCYFFY